MAALQHTEVPYDVLVESLADNQAPLFQVMLVMQGAAPTEVTLPELEVTVDELSTGAAKFDLQVILTDRGDHLDGQLNYASQLFDSDTMSGLADRFTMLLDAVAATRNPSSATSISQLRARRNWSSSVGMPPNTPYRSPPSRTWWRSRQPGHPRGPRWSSASGH